MGRIHTFLQAFLHKLYTATAALMKSGGKHECRLSRAHNIWETQKDLHDGNGAKFFRLLIFNKKREGERREREPGSKMCT